MSYQPRPPHRPAGPPPRPGRRPTPQPSAGRGSRRRQDDMITIGPTGTTGPPAWAKLTIAVILLAVAAVGYGLLTKPDGPPAVPTITAPRPQPEARLPTSWKQTYETNLRYSGHSVTVRWVDLTRLNRSRTKVIYRLTIYPRPGASDRWVSDRRRYNLRAADRHQTARRVKTVRSGKRRTVFVTFTWPRERAYRGGHLEIQVPGVTGRPKLLKIGLEVPRSNHGTDDRTGLGGAR